MSFKPKKNVFVLSVSHLMALVSFLAFSSGIFNQETCLNKKKKLFLKSCFRHLTSKMYIQVKVYDFFLKLWYSFINYWNFLRNWMDVHDIAFKKSFQYLFYKQFQLLHSINIKEDNSFCFVVVRVAECVLFYFGFFFCKDF